jgi:hypothetical protein
VQHAGRLVQAPFFDRVHTAAVRAAAELGHTSRYLLTCACLSDLVTRLPLRRPAHAPRVFTQRRAADDFHMRFLYKVSHNSHYPGHADSQQSFEATVEPRLALPWLQRHLI